MNQTLS